MKRNDRTVPKNRPATGRQVAEFGSKLLRSIPYDLGSEDMQFWIGNEWKLQQELRKLLFQGRLPEREALADWRRLYTAMEVCSSESLDGMLVRVRPEGFERLVVVHEQMSLPAIRYLYTEAEIGLRFWDISEADLQGAKHRRYSDRVWRIPYAVWTRDAFRPDMVYMSPDELVALEVAYMNLPEFLLLFWKYWNETGLPFDDGTFTMLPDTWFEDGTIPVAHWKGDHLEVFRVTREFKADPYGARSVWATM